ncbi:MAG TPA: hypothetical protein VIM62_02480 [Acidobacteriaceae bacterium]
MRFTVFAGGSAGQPPLQEHSWMVTLVLSGESPAHTPPATTLEAASGMTTQGGKGYDNRAIPADEF